MGFSHSIVLVLAVVGSTLAFTAEYIPKSYFVIHEGQQSPTVFLRDKRSLQNLIPLVRMRRSDTGYHENSNSNTGAGSYSGSSSFSSGSGGGTGAGGQDAVHFADNLAAGLASVMKLAGFPHGVPGFPGGVPGAAHAGFPSGGAAGGVGGYGNGLAAPDLHSRFGGGGDDGISYSGSAEGAKGVYSASSSSIDGDGNVKYSVKTGKF